MFVYPLPLFCFFFKGAPEFLNTFLENVTLAVGGNISLVFPVQTHSNKITSCTISKDSCSIQHTGSPYSSHIAYNCKLHSFNGSDGYSFTVMETQSNGLGASHCVCSSLTGIAPNLTLIVSMFNLSSQHTGQWRVIVNNYVGSGHAEFILNVTEGMKNVNNKKCITRSEKGPHAYIIFHSLGNDHLLNCVRMRASW